MGDLRAKCMGRSRGGLTTKIHALCDAKGWPIKLRLSEGQANDGKSGDPMLDDLGKGQVLLADSAYDSDARRQMLKNQGAKACIKPMPNRINIPPFDKKLYSCRNVVERFFNKIKHFRAIATRYEKYDQNFLALVKLASIKICLRVYESVS